MSNIFNPPNASPSDIGFYTYIPSGDLLGMVKSKTLRKGAYYELQAAVTNSPFTGLSRSYCFYIAPRDNPRSRELWLWSRETGEIYRNHLSGQTGAWVGWKAVGVADSGSDSTTLALLNAKIGTLVPKVDPCTSGNIPLLNSDGTLRESNVPLTRLLTSNQAGQVKARYTGLNATGFTSNVPVRLFLREASSATLEDAPTTLWPQAAITSATNTYETGFFIQGPSEADDRLRENNCYGQVHRWRVAGNYTNKDINNLGRLRCFILNPDTLFKVSGSLLLPSGVTTDDYTFEFTSIADNASLDVGRGYQLWFVTSFDDSEMIINVNSIVRISEAIDILR